jgi:carnitine-CoA ligase
MRFTTSVFARGDRAGVMLGNRPEHLTSWFGMVRAGVIEVPLNTSLRGDLLAYMLRLTDCRLLVIDAQWRDRVAGILPNLPSLQWLVVVVVVDGDGAGEVAVAGVASLRFGELLEAPADPPAVKITRWDRSVILFSSGTTGPSKGVVLTHNADLGAALNVCEMMDYEQNDRLFNAFPLFHVNARYTGVVAAMVLDRGALVLHDRFSASRFWDICGAQRVNAFNFLGALVMILLKQPERDDDADNPVRVAYGSPAPVALVEPFERRFGVKLIEAYGSTGLASCIQNTPSRRKTGSCGREAPHFVVEIHDEHDNPVPDGVQGEIVVRPRESHIMLEESFANRDATVAASRNLWFHTGDRGRRDADGWFFFVDRMKDAIRRRGENISRWEVEQVLNDHQAVEEAAVVGVPSELTEEEVLAVVKLKSGQELSPEALLDFYQDRLPHFAVPRYVRFVEQLPKNPQQRIEK